MTSTPSASVLPNAIPIGRVVDRSTWRADAPGVVGIDPGKSGCIAFLYITPPMGETGVDAFEGMFWQASTYADVQSALDAVRSYTVLAALEELNGNEGFKKDASGARMKGKGITGAFQQGVYYGKIQGWLDGKISYGLIKPSEWYKGLPEKPPKGMSYLERKRWTSANIRRWLPNLGPYVSQGAADALAIAYALRTNLL